MFIKCLEKEKTDELRSFITGVYSQRNDIRRSQHLLVSIFFVCAVFLFVKRLGPSGAFFICIGLIVRLLSASPRWILRDLHWYSPKRGESATENDLGKIAMQ